MKGHERRNHNRKVKNFKETSNKEEITKDKDDAELEEYSTKKIHRITVESIGRTGGVYIPPFKLARLQVDVSKDSGSHEYQRQSWEALRKSINGLVNKVNVGNIRNLVQELFRENLVRGRGLLARAIIRAQMASPGFTHVYAALLAILNSKLPELGELVLKRVLLQFRRAYRRNDKIVCTACVKFLAHLVNQRVVHEVLALQLATLLLENLTDDSVELCVSFIQEVGKVLSELFPQGFNAIFERFRGILREGEIDKRVQYTVEKLFDTNRKKFSDFPGVIPELDLVEEMDQIIHEIDLLDDTIQGNEMLNIFKPEDPEEFLEKQKKWQTLSREILGEEDHEQESNDTSEDSEEEEEEEEEEILTNQISSNPMVIRDMTEQDIINLRKTIYLTIMSSASYEECVHKLLKLNIKTGCEIEVCTMLIDCGSMERTFQRFFPLQAERLSKLNPVYQECFIQCLKQQYDTVHRLETNKLRNTAKFFAHLLYKDAIPWNVLEIFVITEATTTSASRIFIKIIFQELAEHMGIKKLFERLHEPALQTSLAGVFPCDTTRNIRFSINFFTAIGLGILTENLRKLLSAS